MKKLLLSAIAFMAVATSVAQEMALQQSEFFDNWSITLKGGGCRFGLIFGVYTATAQQSSNGSQ